MRVPAHFRPMLFGLTFVIGCQMLVPQAQAWDWNPFGSGSQPANAVPNSELRAGTAGATGDQRWMDRSAVEQVSAESSNGRGTVLQAVWGDPSQEAATAQKKAAAAAAAKRRAIANSQNTQANAHSSASPASAPRNAPATNNAPTYHGAKLKVPQMPFSRSSSKGAPPTRPRAATPGAVNGPAPRVATQQSAVQNQNRNSQGIATRPINSVANAARPGAAATPTTAPTSNNQPKFQAPVIASKPDRGIEVTAAAPSNGPTLASADGPELAEPTIGTAPAAPKTAAERLIVQAHELSSQAQTEEEFTRVITTCRHTLASQPTTPVAHYANELASWALNRRGQIKAETGRTKEASLDFDDAIRLNAECWRAIHNRGVLQAEAGNFEGAFDDFNRTIQIKPDFAKAYSNRAALFVLANDLQPALSDYSKAIEFDSSLAVAQRGYGRVCHLMGRLDEAIIHYDAAVQLAPQDAYAVASRADVLTDLGRYADAVADYDHSLQIDSRSANAYRGSAWLLATCPDNTIRDAALAVERAQLAIQYDKKADSISYDTLAAAQASAGDFRSAVESIRRAIELAPANERDVYQNRLGMYQRAKPYRIAPIQQQVSQASYEQ